MPATVEEKAQLFDAWCTDCTTIRQSLQRISRKTEQLFEGELTEETITAIERHMNWILCLEKVLQ